MSSETQSDTRPGGRRELFWLGWLCLAVMFSMFQVSDTHWPYWNSPLSCPGYAVGGFIAAALIITNRPRSRRERTAMWLLPLLALLVFASVRVWFRHEFHYWGEVAPMIERDLGFQLDSLYTEVDGELREFMAFDQVVPGGAIDKAGGQEGDIIVDPWRSWWLYKRLHYGKGKTVEISATRGGEGLPLAERQHHVLRIRVPN